MAEWPDLDEFKALLDVTGTEFDDHLESLLAAGVAQVKEDVQFVDDVDTVTDRLHHAALRAAVLSRPNAPGVLPGATGRSDVRSDPGYQSLIRGRRRRFPIA